MSDELWAQVVARFGDRAWRPGMQEASGDWICIHVYPNGDVVLAEHCASPETLDLRPLESQDYTPDFDHDGTRGCLLGLVRELWGDPLLHVEPWSGGSVWRPMDGPGDCVLPTPCEAPKTEGEALLRAILAAPEGA